MCLPAQAPAIIFIDEIDAMGGKRGRVSVGSNSDRQTLNQLLACMDGFSKNEGIIVIGAACGKDRGVRKGPRPQPPPPTPTCRGVARGEVWLCEWLCVLWLVCGGWCVRALGISRHQRG